MRLLGLEMSEGIGARHVRKQSLARKESDGRERSALTPGTADADLDPPASEWESARTSALRRESRVDGRLDFHLEASGEEAWVRCSGPDSKVGDTVL